jgi:hypothetical protein
VSFAVDPGPYDRFMANVEAMLEAGAEGAIIQFADEAAMRDFVRRYR